jgi:hypothetical protein
LGSSKAVTAIHFTVLTHSLAHILASNIGHSSFDYYLFFANGMEPDWTKPIPNRTVCDFYYLFFWFRAVSAGLLLLALIFTMYIEKVIVL